MLPKIGLGKNKPPEKFREIFNNYFPTVCRQAAFILGNTQAAEDIAQEVFLKLYYSPPEELTNVGGWLARVATNRSFNYLKSEKSRKWREEKNLLEKAGNVVSLEDLVLKNQEVIKVRDTLNKMPEKDKTALILRFSGYSYEEIADNLGVGKSSVGTILARAQEKFRKMYLSKEGGDSYVL
jgi:RNA polymerase sigma factor (sigma-70 family)